MSKVTDQEEKIQQLEEALEELYSEQNETRDHQEQIRFELGLLIDAAELNRRNYECIIRQTPDHKISIIKDDIEFYVKNLRLITEKVNELVTIV